MEIKRECKTNYQTEKQTIKLNQVTFYHSFFFVDARPSFFSFFLCFLYVFVLSLVCEVDL